MTTLLGLASIAGHRDDIFRVLALSPLVCAVYVLVSLVRDMKRRRGARRRNLVVIEGDGLRRIAQAKTRGRR